MVQYVKSTVVLSANIKSGYVERPGLNTPVGAHRLTQEADAPVRQVGVQLPDPASGYQNNCLPSQSYTNMQRWWECWQDEHMYHKSLNKALNKLKNITDVLQGNAECCECLPKPSPSRVEMKIKCHHRAVSPRLTESVISQFIFPAQENPVQHSQTWAACLLFPNISPKATKWKWNTLIRDYLRPQNMVILPLGLALMACKNTIKNSKNTKHAAKVQFLSGNKLGKAKIPYKWTRLSFFCPLSMFPAQTTAPSLTFVSH